MVVFELIAKRCEHKSLAITANTPFSQWGEVFGEPTMTLAAVDRLVHHSTIRPRAGKLRIVRIELLEAEMANG